MTDIAFCMYKLPATKWKFTLEIGTSYASMESQCPYHKCCVSEIQYPNFAHLGCFISQPMKYARARSSCEDFILRAMWFTNMLLEKKYVRERLKSSLFMDETGT